jgi:hypothetical protein
MEILNNIVMLLTLTIIGAGVVIAYLALATFPWMDWLLGGMCWLLGGMIALVLFIPLSFLLPAWVAFLISLFLAGLVQLLPLAILESRNEYIRRWVPYFAWLYFWVTVLIGWRRGWLGLLTISAPALLILGGGLFFVSGFLLPFPKLDIYRGNREAPRPGAMPMFWQELQDFLALFYYPENKDARKKWIERRRQALRCLLTYALGTNYPYYTVVDERITERTEGENTWMTTEEKLRKRVEGDLFSEYFSGPGIILSGPDQAVVLSSGLNFKGPKDPGVIFTGTSDRPTHVIDLKVQLRAFPVRAWTKDGIEVEFFTFIPFQIGTGKEKPTLGKSFPYRASDVFRAVHAQLIEHETPSQIPDNLKQHEWFDLPQIVGEQIVRDAVSRYEFDELYAPFELYDKSSSDQHPRSEISGKLAEGLDDILPNWGIQRIGCGIGNIEPVDDRVLDQRIEAWRADWTRQIMIQRAIGKSHRTQKIEQARAQAQVDVILNIGRRLERLQSFHSPVSMDDLAGEIIGILENLVHQARMRRSLNRDMEDIFYRVQGGLRIGGQSDAEGGE